MTITDAIADVFLKATGKTNTLTSGTKYNRIIALLDFYQRRWSRENGIDWNSLYDPAFSIGTVTTTDSYDLDTSTLRKISPRQGDSVRIMHDDGSTYTDYDLVEADKLKDYYWGQDKESFTGHYCARVGGELKFNHTFTTDDAQYGGDIQVPCYLYADPITSDAPDTDEIQVDDPDWLVVQCAAEYCRNDITRRSRYPELQSEANSIMQRMREDQEGKISKVETPWTPGMGTDGIWD